MSDGWADHRAARRPDRAGVLSLGLSGPPQPDVSWFVHPWLFGALTAWVVWIIYRCEFRSRLLKTLAAPEDNG